MQQHLDHAAGITEFELLGRKWWLHPVVFSPALTPVTELFTTWLPFPVDGEFLEIGCGAGVTAVQAATAGCRRVLATDISEAAVRNTRDNVERHDVGDRVTAARSDLFDQIAPDARFDLVYWNSNFAEPPEGYRLQTDLDKAFFDPGYQTHRRYIHEGLDRLKPGGRLMIGFSSIGNWELLQTVCAEVDIEPVVIQRERRRFDVEVEFQLIELAPRAHRSGGRGERKEVAS